MDMRKTAAIVVLGAVAIVGALALLRIYSPEAVGFLTRLPFVIGLLVLLVGVSAVSIAYGFGLEGSLGRSGKRFARRSGR